MMATPAGTREPNTSWLLWTPYDAYITRIHRELALAGYPDIRPAHGSHVFRHLRVEGSRLTELAERAQLTKQSMGYLVDYLEKRGYVKRILDPADNRAKLIQLTVKGWEVTQAAEQIIQQIEVETTRQLGAEKHNQLRRLLQDYSTILNGEREIIPTQT